MMSLRTLVAGGLLSAVVAISLVQRVVAADEAESKDKASGPPSATVELASEQMRLIMGGTAGKGVLHYNGVDYPFTFKTASAGVGAKAVTSVSATGEVYSLKQVEDFAGKYTSISRSAMAGSSEVSASYKNDKGVEVHLRGTVKGVGLSLGGGIATIELAKQ